jgi:hypothetical protein
MKINGDTAFKSGPPGGHIAFIDSDRDGGGEALRFTSKETLVRGMPEADPAEVVDAFRQWLSRAMKRGMPEFSAGPPDQKADGDIRFRTGDTTDLPGVEVFRLAEDGAVLVRGVFVEYDPSLRGDFDTLMRLARYS